MGDIVLIFFSAASVGPSSTDTSDSLQPDRRMHTAHDGAIGNNIPSCRTTSGQTYYWSHPGEEEQKKFWAERTTDIRPGYGLVKAEGESRLAVNVFPYVLRRC